MPTTLTISGLHKNYDDTQVIRNISFEIHNEEFVSILGPSGCGKTTLLNIISGLTSPTKGNILLNGQPINHTATSGLLALAFQKPVLLPWRTILENIHLPSEILKKDIPKDASQRMIELVGLKGFEHHYPHQLSGGMQQRAAIARILTYSPSILLMDEPFGSLDEMTRTQMDTELLNIWQKLKPLILFITHNIHEAILLSDRIIILDKRPAQILKIVDVPLPRPRTPDLTSTQLYQDTLQCIREYLQ